MCANALYIYIYGENYNVDMSITSAGSKEVSTSRVLSQMNSFLKRENGERGEGMAGI